MSVTRYTHDADGTHPDPAGAFVHYQDHLAALSASRDERHASAYVDGLYTAFKLSMSAEQRTDRIKEVATKLRAAGVASRSPSEPEAHEVEVGQTWLQDVIEAPIRAAWERPTPFMVGEVARAVYDAIAAKFLITHILKKETK